MSPSQVFIKFHILYFLLSFSLNSVWNRNIPSIQTNVKTDVEGSPRSTIPPPGSLIVRQTDTQEGEFQTIAGAAEALNNLTGPQSIFIAPGVYWEQVQIKYHDPLTIQGFSENPDSLDANQVTVHVEVSAKSRGGENALSSGMWIRSPRFQMSNVNVINSFGSGTDTQAVAVTAQGEKHVYKYCLFSSYQDTLYIKTLSSYFYGCRVYGAVDFIFGSGLAWFEMSDIVVKPPKYYATITAHKRGPESNTMFVFNKCQVLPSSSDTPATSAYLGRPWSPYASVTFQSCYISEVINPEGWIGWNPSAENRTEHVKFQEIDNHGPGSSLENRQYLTEISEPLQIENVLGSDYTDWTN